MKKKVYLVRHGEQLKGINDPGLSPLGKRQAEATAFFLASIGPFAGIYISTKRRTSETAAPIIARYPNVTPTFTDDLVERKIIMGNYTDQSGKFDEAQFQADWDRASRERDWAPDGGESAIACGERIDSVLQSLPESDRPYLVFTHGGAIKDALENQLSLEKINRFRFVEGNGQRPKGYQHCSITTIILEGQKYSLERVASIGHLEGIGMGEGGRLPGERR